MTDPLAWMAATEIAASIARRERTAADVVEAALARIARVDGELHSFLTVMSTEARATAEQLDARQRRGEPLGALHGVPVSLKDEVWTAGVRSTAGSLLYAEFVPDTDAEVVTRLRRAGAVIVGKAQLPEFAAWPRSTNLVGPEARNPHDPSRISGASSGGSAAGVAAGLVPLSVGSDGGGSIRIPSALCGTFGLFPTPGLVPDAGTFSYSPFASLGPISRAVGDAAVLLDVITDGTAAGLADLDAGVAGVRIAFTPDFGWIDVDPRIAAAAERTALALEGVGAIVERPGVEIDDVWPVFGTATRGGGLYLAERRPFTMSDEHMALAAANLDRLTPPMAIAMSMPAPTREEHEVALVAVDRARAQMRSWLDRYDVVCSPTMATVAPPIPGDWEMPYPDGRMGTNFTSIANICRQPAASYPCGTVDGLPVGFQVIAAPHAEALLLRVCRALERVAPFDVRPATAER